jgi:hypothetical protein
LWGNTRGGSTPLSRTNKTLAISHFRFFRPVASVTEIVTILSDKKNTRVPGTELGFFYGHPVGSDLYFFLR